MARFFLARFWQILHNFDPKLRTVHPMLGLALHITEGHTLSGTWATFSQYYPKPEDRRSAHFGCPKERKGEIEVFTQFLDTDIQAWAQGSPGNAHWVSFENVGMPGDSMTPYQIEMCAYTLAWLNLNEQVPLQLSDDPARAGLSYHAIFGGHPNCPGTPMIAQRQAIVDRAQELAASTVKYALQWPT